MDRHQFAAVNDELERYDCLLKASEDWAGIYNRDADSHAALIRAEASLEKHLRAFFRDVAAHAGQLINWHVYTSLVRADYTVDVAVNDQAIDDAHEQFINVVFDDLLLATTIGAAAGEAIYKIPLGIANTDAIMQQLTTEHIANLVGKRVDKETGKLIDNPKAKYRISDKMRNDIKHSVQTSIALGEDQGTATERIARTIKNPKRAATIAQTEAVNAYGNGLLEFANQSGATGKEWQTVGAIDVCAEYAGEGIVPLDYLYDGLLRGPAAHPRCRCGLRIVYANEYKGA